MAPRMSERGLTSPRFVSRWKGADPSAGGACFSAVFFSAALGLSRRA
ncbi:hypothetical protein PLANPX_2944 [Lacipirellula parvula]|uniref:Uncharacterized protein n=1 Tax=Lacipirellula parvula TaxID=2650471 RepID=A0A5K7XBK7_9BACT|nr:hypothetical protein PLANPX_2944 [Lacipirellula parvula]